jgi:hypothetical protein
MRTTSAVSVVALLVAAGRSGPGWANTSEQEAAEAIPLFNQTDSG